ncbi:hypothetical protein KBD33_04030, partial [Candidatus Gracilibacteria bacterium]|nr:hypothetical protein [Candidatus Gracilibacteria bacterium]
TGNKTLYVRIKAQGVNPAGPAVTLNFTTNPDITAPSLTSSASLSSSSIGATVDHTLTFDESVASFTLGVLPTGMNISVSGSGNTRTLSITTTASFTSFGSVSIPFTVTDTAGNPRTESVSKIINDLAPVAGGAFAALGDMTVSD